MFCRLKNDHVTFVVDASLLLTFISDTAVQCHDRSDDKDIVEFPVWLGMNLIQNKTRHVQAMLRANFGRQNLIESCVPVVHDALGGCHNLATFQKCRGHLCCTIIHTSFCRIYVYLHAGEIRHYEQKPRKELCPFSVCVLDAPLDCVTGIRVGLIGNLQKLQSALNR